MCIGTAMAPTGFRLANKRLKKSVYLVLPSKHKRGQWTFILAEVADTYIKDGPLVTTLLRGAL